MTSEHKSQTFMYDIRDDIKYDLIHDFKVCIPTLENVLGRALPKSLLAASSSASLKSVTVICCPPQQGLARPLRLTHPDWRCANASATWCVPVRPLPVGPPPSHPPSSSPSDTCIFSGRPGVAAPAPPAPPGVRGAAGVAAGL